MTDGPAEGSGEASRGSAVDPHADWPNRTTLTNASGVLTLAFTAAESTREATPWADGVWVPAGVPVPEAVALALQTMPGWFLSTSDERLAAALLASGAAERRHAHSMTHSLEGASLPSGELARAAPDVSIEPLSAAQVDRHALRFGAVYARAYPPGHPDAFERDEAAAVSQLRAIARGELLGPMISESRVALFGGRIVGACLVVDRPGAPPYGGPWVLDVFRDPASRARGVGSALLCAVLASARGARLPGVSLVVSHGNDRARRLYEQLGFVDVQESWTLALPPMG